MTLVSLSTNTRALEDHRCTHALHGRHSSEAGRTEGKWGSDLCFKHQENIQRLRSGLSACVLEFRVQGNGLTR